MAIYNLISCAAKETESLVVKTKSCTIAIEGMMCEKGCKTTIHNKLKEMEGVINCEVDFPLNQAYITYDANITSAEKFIEKINSIADGIYKATMVEDKDIENAPVGIEENNKAESVSVKEYQFELPSISSLLINLI